MAAETTLDPSAAPGPYRNSDYMALPDEPRCELLWGHLVVTPSPLRRHQHVLFALGARLRTFALAAGHECLLAPMDVTLFEHTVLQPDLLLIARDRRGIARERIEGAPDLVVEILSPSSARRDRLVKLALYARGGVPEYWIVDPEAQTIDFLVLRADAYSVALPDGDTYRSTRFPDFTLKLEPLWDEIERTLTGQRPD